MESCKRFFEENIRLEILAVIWLLYLWELYLSMRQRKLMQALPTPPTSLKGLMPLDVYQKARNYSLDKNTFRIYFLLFSAVFDSVFIISFALYYFWQSGKLLLKIFGLGTEDEILTSAACMFIMNTVTIVIKLPFTIYEVFGLEHKYHFNKQTAEFFAMDQLKKFVAMQIIGLPIICCIIWIVKNGGAYVYLYLWLFSIIIGLFILVVYQELIAPRFNKYSPLPEGKLKRKIKALAASVNFPLYKLYIVENSKRSSHSNAYMYGFYNSKRIVLFDTLIKGYGKSESDRVDEDKGCEVDEVVAILAHELGHWEYNHNIQSLLLAQINFGINLLLFALLQNYKPMYAAFDFTDYQPVLIGLTIITMYIKMPLNTLMSFLQALNSRKLEFQADQFAKELGYAEPLKRALVKLQKDNLDYPLFDKLYSTWHLRHAPLLERLDALDDKK